MTHDHKPMTHSLLLVGCGKMGGALLARWKTTFPNYRFDVIEPNSTQWHKNLGALPDNYTPGVIVFAVKPQQLDAILPAYCKRFGSHSPLYISIAAGKNLAFYADHLGAHAHVVRVMPNTPALVGQSMSVLSAADTLPASMRNTATQLMEAVGKVEWLDDESLMDAVTALSGSGPAYVFLFLDSLVKGGIAAGLPENIAKTLALQTVSGSLALAAGSHENLGQLRQNVTSPGGTTEAALKVLMSNNMLENMMKEAVLAATKRSKELL